MKAEVITKGLKAVGRFVSDKSPTLLTIAAVGGVVTTVVMTGRATLKAQEIIEAEKEERSELVVDDEGHVDTREGAEIKPIEYVMLTWKVYLPVAISGGLTIASIIMSHKISTRRTLALSALYSTSVKALEEYQAKVVEQIGKNKEAKIHEDIAQDALNRYPVDDHNIIYTGCGETLCFDVMSGRYFKSNIESIRQAQNDFNQTLLYEMRMSLNDLYGMMNIPFIELGYEVGWTVDHMLEFHFESKLASNGTPCLVVNYTRPPASDYRDWG